MTWICYRYSFLIWCASRVFDILALYKLDYYYYYYYLLKPTSTKPQAEILTLNNVNGCNDVSFGDHSVLEGDRITPLKSHEQALEEELCFPGVLSDNRDASANLLRHFYGFYYYYCYYYYSYYTEIPKIRKIAWLESV